jgi:hypothetical protein
VRLVVLLVLLAACSTPCPLVCEDNTQCFGGYYCLNQSACLPDCLQRCGGSCVETVTNCGACGRACTGTQRCSQGQCLDACATGLTDCAGSCYDIQADRTHCGGCDAPACNTDETCVKGVCTKVDVCQ